MKLHSSKTLIQAQKRLQADLIKDHAREALDALSKEFKFKLNTKVEERRRGGKDEYVSYTRISTKDIGILRLVFSSSILAVVLEESSDRPGTIILEARLTYTSKKEGSIGASAGIYAYDVDTKKLTYLRHD